MLVKICDAPMGAGKTSAAINYMNQHWEKNFLFVTPYLTEVERICSACAEREFVAPENKGEGKLEDLIQNVQARNCIASTHALLSTYNDTAATTIKDAGYTLILDEVANVLDLVEITKADVLGILNNWATYDKDTGRVIWLDNTYNGKFNNIKRMAQSNRLIFFQQRFFVLGISHRCVRGIRRGYHSYLHVRMPNSSLLFQSIRCVHATRLCR